MKLSRRIRRLLLIPRARQVAFERHMLDMEDFLSAIRGAPSGMPMPPTHTEE